LKRIFTTTAHLMMKPSSTLVPLAALLLLLALLFRQPLAAAAAAAPHPSHRRHGQGRGGGGGGGGGGPLLHHGHGHHRHGRALSVLSFPDLPPATGPFDAALGYGTPNLPSNDSRVARAAPGCYPEGVRLTYWTESSVLVSWSTCDAVSAPRVTKLSTAGMTSLVALGTAPDAYTRNFTGVAASYAINYRWPPGAPSWATPAQQAFARSVLEYASPALHHVLLTG
jgi:hypothetical protein